MFDVCIVSNAMALTTREIKNGLSAPWKPSDMRQSKTLLTIDEQGSKIVRNSVFDCHLSPVGRQLAIENCF